MNGKNVNHNDDKIAPAPEKGRDVRFGFAFGHAICSMMVRIYSILKIRHL